MRLWIQFKNRRKTVRPLMLRQTEAKKFRKISRFRLFFSFSRLWNLPTTLCVFENEHPPPGAVAAFRHRNAAGWALCIQASIGIAYTGVYAWVLPAAEAPALIGRAENCLR